MKPFDRAQTIARKWRFEGDDELPELDKLITEGIEAAVAEEREACAKVAETLHKNKHGQVYYDLGPDLANAIRARNASGAR